jgi:4,5-DOPA dioxygenase extradiol
MLPTLFLSHGSPMHGINAGPAGEVWAALAQAIPTPTAALMVTAHWETNLPMLSGNPRPSMIYDFGGFPDALYRIKYAAPGAPDIAERAVSLLKAANMTAAVDGCRGMDHGTWVPLLKMFPQANVPIIQLSVQPTLGTAHHYRVGRALAALRGDNVLMVGSGHITHNLRDWMAGNLGSGENNYAQEFQAWMFDRIVAHDIDSLLAYRELAPHAARAHPSEEHLLPLFVALGAAGDGYAVERVFAGFEGAALAMDAYRFS